jgi:hypothetical protein
MHERGETHTESERASERTAVILHTICGISAGGVLGIGGSCFNVGARVLVATPEAAMALCSGAGAVAASADEGAGATHVGGIARVMG